MENIRWEVLGPFAGLMIGGVALYEWLISGWHSTMLVRLEDGNRECYLRLAWKEGKVPEVYFVSEGHMASNDYNTHGSTVGFKARNEYELHILVGGRGSFTQTVDGEVKKKTFFKTPESAPRRRGALHYHQHITGAAKTEMSDVAALYGTYVRRHVRGGPNLLVSGDTLFQDVTEK